MTMLAGRNVEDDPIKVEPLRLAFIQRISRRLIVEASRDQPVPLRGFRV
jgi:hypothetical protein